MSRKPVQTLIAFTAALLLAPLASLQAADPPSLAGSFPLGVYWPWERTDGLAKRNGLEKWAFVERCLDDLKARGFFWNVYLPPPADQPEAKPYVGPAFPQALAVKAATPVHAPGGLIRPDGAATPEYLAVAEAFAALKPLLPVLKGAVPADPSFGEISAPGWIGGLTNPELKRTFAAVVNDDTNHEQTLKVRLLNPHDVRDLRTGQVLRRATDNTVPVKLGPGDGALLEETPSP